jgi:glyoxylase-like metal-dependent hydrolase (beta-lactamase superfamily II)
MKRIVIALTISLGLQQATEAQQRTPAQQLVDAAARALGGAESIRSARTLVLEGTGDNFNFGQNLRPDAPLPRFEVTEFRRSVDLTQGRWRHEQTRVPRFVTGNSAPVRQITALDGDVAFNIAASGAATRASHEVAAARRRELLQHPITILQLALRPDVTVSDLRTTGNERSVTVRSPDGTTFTLVVAGNTNLPVRVSYMVDNTNLGDVATIVEFSDYRASGGLQLPHRLVTKLDRYTTADLRVSRAAVNTEVADLAAPQDVRTAAIPAAPAINVLVEDLAPGVWRLAGQSHHSVVVEFRDHLLMIEAPQNEARTLAVIQRARELRPDKPLNQVVMTHHHFDHSGGIRAAAAEGLTIVTQEGNVAFVRDVLRRPHAIAPDALTRKPNPSARVLGIARSETRNDGVGTVQLHHLVGNPHSQTMLFAYLPQHRILIQADLYNPVANAPANLTFPFAANLVEFVRRMNLPVERVAGIHGAVIPWADVVSAAQKR